MYTFGQWIKIYRHLTMGGYPKKACPQQLLQTVNEHDKYTVIKITVICVSFRKNKVGEDGASWRTGQDDESLSLIITILHLSVCHIRQWYSCLKNI